MAKKKKKAVHWSKLPRAKLIARCKSFELQCAKLKTQVAELRETRLLNERRPNPLPELAALDRVGGNVFPWETK